MWAGYIRVSRVGDRGDRLISPDLQAADINGYAAARRLDVRILEPELNESGGRLDRPTLESALAGIEAGDFEGIIVARLDRLSRSLPHSIELFRRVEAADGEIIAVAEQIDSSTPAGRMQRNMLFAIADYQLDGYRESFQSARESAVARGVWIAPRVPIGYQLNADRRLEPGQAAGLVRRVFALRATGSPYRALARLLEVSNAGVPVILANRVYLGEVRSGAFVNEAAHEPLVDPETWAAAQHEYPRYAGRPHQPALLARVLRCGSCGQHLTRSPDIGSYRCKRNRYCEKGVTISIRMAEERACEVLLTLLAELRARGTPHTDARDAARASLAEAQAELTAYQEATAALGSVAQFRSGLELRAGRVTDAQRALSELGGSVEVDASLGELWPTLSAGERAHVLRGAIGAIYVYAGRGTGRLRWFARGSEPPPGTLPVPNHPGEIRPASA